MTCLKSDEDSIKKCVSLLKQNEVLILPTDTVYGFSGLVGSTDSLIRKIKGRAENKPFIQLISSPEYLKNLTDDEIPLRLLDYWPGPLTLIVKSKFDYLKTIAVRCPGDPWLRKIIEEAGAPIYSTSVNRSSCPVLSNIREIEKEFSSEVALIVDDGDKNNTVPSTIAKVDDGKIVVLRQGAVVIG